MKKIHAVLMGAMLVLALSACVEEKDLGPIIEETFELNAFTELEAETLGEIRLIPSNEFKVVLRTHQVVRNDVRVSVSQGRLLLKYSAPSRQNQNIREFNYDVYVPHLNYIRLNDVANITGHEGFATDRLEIILDDVGNITLYNLALDQIDVALNDVGDVKISGQTDIANYFLRDVGNIKAFDMTVRDCRAHLKGVGDIQLYATEKLHAIIQGVGNIEYKGQPSISTEVSGEGRVVSKN